MSFILDALRKSDAERQRTVSPGLSDVRYARPPVRRSLWIPVVAVVLIANLAFMAFQWLRTSGDAAIVTAPIPATEPWPLAAPIDPPPPPVRSLAREAEPASRGSKMTNEIPEAPAVAMTNPSAARPPSGTGSGSGATTAVAPSSPTVREAAPASAMERPANENGPSWETGLPTAGQLIAQGSLNVPELQLDLHVYSPSAADRFVMINARRYAEGAALREGPTIESITPDGVILASQGTRFVLPRK